MRKVLLLFLVLLLTGCANLRTVGNNESYIEDADGKQIFLVSMRKDAKVIYKTPDGSIFEVDNRGRESIFEGIAKLYSMQFIEKEVN